MENDIHYIKINFWPEFREKLKTAPNTTIRDAQEEIERWNRDVANVRRLRDLDRSPEEIFQDEEVKTLKPLPPERAESTQWVECLVRKDWSVLFSGSRYSVPYGLIDKTVQVRATSGFVKIFSEHQEVASHVRTNRKGSYVKCVTHAPPFKEEVLNCNRHGLLVQAEVLGENVLRFCEQMFSDVRVDKLRPVRHLLRLSQKFGKDRLDKACARALKFNTIRFLSVKDILEKGLDAESLEGRMSVPQQFHFRHARSRYEYQSEQRLFEAPTGTGSI